MIIFVLIVERSEWKDIVNSAKNTLISVIPRTQASHLESLVVQRDGLRPHSPIYLDVNRVKGIELATHSLV